MNVIVIDSFDWANRIGETEDAAWSDGTRQRPSELYEGVIAHELEHLLMNYSRPRRALLGRRGPGRLAAFLNGFDIPAVPPDLPPGLPPRDVADPWGGGLENYGASFTYFLYLWEQAGGNGDGTCTPDLAYDDAGGDLLIKLIFEEQADGMEGVQNAIDTFNAQTGGDLRSARTCSRTGRSRSTSTTRARASSTSRRQLR